MKLIEFAVKRSIAVAMVFVAIIVFGVVSFPSLKMDLFPDVELPYAVVYTQYYDASPSEIEALVTKPLESALSTVSNLDSVQSVSGDGTSMIILSFVQGTDMDTATMNMREKIAMAEMYLPSDAEDSVVMQIDTSMLSRISLAAYGGRDLRELKEVMEDTVQPRLERLEGVGGVTVSGGFERVIEVTVNPAALTAYGLTTSSLSQAIGADNRNYAGGSAADAGKTLPIRIMGEYKDISELANMPITTATGGIIRLSDVATVADVVEEQQIIARINGEPGVSLDVTLESGANMVSVSRELKAELQAMQKDLPDGIEVAVIYDSAKYIQFVLSSLANNLIIGALLALLVLYFFLRDFKLTLIIGLAIPISIIGAGVLLYLSDMSLNLMTIGGLALGVGMLVDNSIVILESIARHRQEAVGVIDDAELLPKTTAISGATESAMAISASTFTTIIIFVPIVFSNGLASMFFTDLASVVAFTLLASLLVSLTLVPMIASKMKTMEVPVSRFAFLEKLKGKAADLFERLRNNYMKLLRRALDHRKKSILIVAACFVLSFAAVPFIGAELMPASDESMLFLNVATPQGTSAEETNEVCLEIEAAMDQYADELETVMVVVGSTSDSQATIMVLTKPVDERKHNIWQLADLMRKDFAAIPGAEITIIDASASAMMGSTDDITYSIKGDDLDTLKLLSDELSAVMSKVKGVSEVKSSIESSKKELRVNIAKQRAQQYGLGVYQISQSISHAFSGLVASSFRDEGREYDIKIVLPDEMNNTTSDLYNVMIDTPYGTQVPLSTIADIEVAEGATSINRVDNSRVVTVSCSVSGRDVAGVSRDIEAAMAKDIIIPSGYFIDASGSLEEMADVFADLTLALFLAVLLVYMVMAAMYESFVDPFVVMFALPPSFIGVVIGLAVMGKTLNISSFIGMIVVVGVVVNNGIVLVDYIKQQREKGMDIRQAVELSGFVRMRPVLMTALTTILAMLPVAFGFGDGAEVSSPMAVAVSFGLTFSTLFTLVLVPVMYSVINEKADKSKNKRKAKKAAREAAKEERQLLANPQYEEEVL